MALRSGVGIIQDLDEEKGKKKTVAGKKKAVK